MVSHEKMIVQRIIDPNLDKKCARQSDPVPSHVIAIKMYLL